MTGLAAVQARISQLQALVAAPRPAAVLGASGTAAGASGVAGAGSASGTTFATALQQALGGAGDVGDRAVALAKEYTGVPYRWGGTDPSTGLDCSGLTQLVYSKLGVTLPRVAADQARAGTSVASLDAARPGDLVFFGSPAHHVGIYVGDGKMIDAPHSGSTVGVHRLWGTPSSIRRVAPEGTGAAVGAAAGPGSPASLAGLGGVGGVGAAGGPAGPYGSLFAAAGRRHGVDPALLSAVAKAESGYDPRAVSPAGARGLMQLMPGTARSLGVDPGVPAQAVDGAARLLAQLLDQFGGRVDLALAGYNAGPGAVRRHGGIPPYPETQTYVQRVTRYWEALR